MKTDATSYRGEKARAVMSGAGTGFFDGDGTRRVELSLGAIALTDKSGNLRGAGVTAFGKSRTARVLMTVDGFTPIDENGNVVWQVPRQR